MTITKIEFGSIADPEVINNNFEYLDEKLTDTSSKIYTNNSSLESMISSQISTLLLQVTSKIEALYPVGSIYIGTTATCPVASMFGTWEKVSEGRVLQGASSSQTAGKTVEAGLPNIKGKFTANDITDNVTTPTTSGALYATHDGARDASNGQNTGWSINFDASRSNAIYGKSNTVQPPAYLVNIWRRTA